MGWGLWITRAGYSLEECKKRLDAYLKEECAYRKAWEPYWWQGRYQRNELRGSGLPSPALGERGNTYLDQDSGAKYCRGDDGWINADALPERPYRPDLASNDPDVHDDYVYFCKPYGDFEEDFCDDALSLLDPNAKIPWSEFDEAYGVISRNDVESLIASRKELIEQGDHIAEQVKQGKISEADIGRPTVLHVRLKPEKGEFSLYFPRGYRKQGRYDSLGGRITVELCNGSLRLLDGTGFSLDAEDAEEYWDMAMPEEERDVYYFLKDLQDLLRRFPSDPFFIEHFD